MSCKVNMTNGVNFENHLYAKAPALDASVKFAGEEAKDRLYECKHQKKLVRVLTVIAYVFFVSLAAIMLSLYYIFIWNGHQKSNQAPYRVYTRCDNMPYAGYQQPPYNSDMVEIKALRTISKTNPKSLGENTEWDQSDFSATQDSEFETTSPLFEKLLRNNFLYSKKYND